MVGPQLDWKGWCRPCSIATLAIVLIILLACPSSAHPLHFEESANTFNARPLQTAISEFLTIPSERGIDNVGPALANATQTALDHGRAILSNYTSVLHGIAIPTGLAASFFGYFLLAPVLFLAAFITGGGACFVAVSTIVEDESPTEAWIAIGAMLLGGALLGFIAMRALPIGMFAVGASLGVVFASSIRTTVIADLFPKDPRTAFIVTAVSLGLILGLLAVFFEKHMLIFSTAYAGAFACAFGVGHFAGHFPTSEDISEAEKGHVNVWTVVYILAAIGVGTIGMLFQFWLARDRPMPEYAPYDRRRRRRRVRRFDPGEWSDDGWDDDVYVERVPLPPRHKRHTSAPPQYSDRHAPTDRVYVESAKGGSGGGVFSTLANVGNSDLLNRPTSELPFDRSSVGGGTVLDQTHAVQAWQPESVPVQTSESRSSGLDPRDGGDTGLVRRAGIDLKSKSETDLIDDAEDEDWQDTDWVANTTAQGEKKIDNDLQDGSVEMNDEDGDMKTNRRVSPTSLVDISSVDDSDLVTVKV